MADLNVMLLEHARTGLQAKLSEAVTNGDTDAAQKAADELAKLSAATAPKAPPYGDVEIKAALETKAEWFGTDPRKSGAAIRLGKDMNPKKFATAEAFADALIKAVDEEFKPAAKEPDDDADPDADNDADPDADDDKKPASKKRASDGPADGDAGPGNRQRRATGPWVKMSDAPADVQKEINRTADKFAPKTKEGRQSFVDRALKAHYDKAQLAKGKK